MSFDKDAFLTALDNMSVMDLNDLVKAIEEKFGVLLPPWLPRLVPVAVVLLQPSLKRRLNSTSCCLRPVPTRSRSSRPFVN